MKLLILAAALLAAAVSVPAPSGYERGDDWNVGEGCTPGEMDYKRDPRDCGKYLQ